MQHSSVHGSRNWAAIGGHINGSKALSRQVTFNKTIEKVLSKSDDLSFFNFLQITTTLEMKLIYLTSTRSNFRKCFFFLERRPRTHELRDNTTDTGP